MVGNTIVIFLAFLANVAPASGLIQEIECYDAEVSAHIISQTPTVMANCGDDCIIMRWPWILEIDVQEIHSGELQSGELAVLTLQHTYFIGDSGPGRWKLRHNTQGGFNVVGFFGSGPERLCSIDDQPARAYITPASGESLDDLLREGREYYGRGD